MTFLPAPPPTPEIQALYDEDMSDLGYVMNASRLWAYRPDVHDGLFALLGGVSSGLDKRSRGILVAACASTLGDSYCALAWGSRLADASSPAAAAGVLSGDDQHLTPREAAMAAWARKVASDPNATTSADVQTLRDAGFSDPEIFDITCYVALRLAFSTVNDALGAQPDPAYRSIPAPVLDAVTFGRPIAD